MTTFDGVDSAVRLISVGRVKAKTERGHCINDNRTKKPNILMTCESDLQIRACLLQSRSFKESGLSILKQDVESSLSQGEFY